MRFYYLLYSLIIFFFFSCRKEYSTYYTAHIENKSNHSALILFYKGGVVLATDSVKLIPGASIRIASGTFRGLNPQPAFFSSYFGGANDSAIVVFNNLYKMSHYVNQPTALSLKHYLFAPPRNIFHPKSYIFESEKKSSTHLANSHNYIITNQDFLDASQ